MLLYLCILLGEGKPVLAGPTSYLSAWNRLTSSFAQVQVIDFDIMYKNSVDAINLLAEGKVTLAFSEVSLGDLLETTKDPVYTNFVELPFLALPFTMICNIPELGDEPLVLNWDILVNMLLGKITQWNHPDVVALNPVLSGVNQTIVHVVSSGNNGITLELTIRLSDFSVEWRQKYGPSLILPNDGSIKTIPTSSHIFSNFAEVFSHPYSIAVADLPFFYNIGFAKGVNFVGFEIQGKTVYANDTEAISESISNSDWTLSKPLEGLDINSSWPLTGMGYMILPKNLDSEANCTDLTDLLRFIRWCYTDPEAQEVKVASAYYPPSKAQLDQILTYLDTLTCDGNEILAVTAILDDRTAEIVVTALFWIIVVIVIILLSSMKSNKTIAKLYGIIFVFGLILCGIALVFWSLVPTKDVICSLRWWFKSLGMIIFSAAVFCRSYQLKKIHYLVKSGRYQATKNIDHFRLLSVLMGVITTIQLIILLVLQLVTPLSSTIIITDEVNRLGEFVCTNDVPFIWMIVQSVYLVCILVLGVYLIYSTWGISSSVDDTRINVLMIFVCLVALAVSDVIVGYSFQDDKSYTWWAISLIMIWSLTMMCSIFLPKLVKAAKSTGSDSKPAL